jgi:predicted dehydrogenase
MRYLHTAPDGTEVAEDALYARRAYYFNNEVHGMHYGEFANYAEYFATARLDGRAAAPDLEEGIETFCIMEAIRRSAQTGQPVAVGPLLAEVGLAPSDR